MRPDEVLRSERPFTGKLVNVRVDTVRLADGRERQREIVEHPGAVGVLARLPDRSIVLVRQYRHAVGRTLLEIPAGTREPDESAEECAIRELAEETGYRADAVRELIRFYVSPGWADEELIIYLAEGVQDGNARPEDDEDLEVVPVRPEEVLGLIQRGEIADSKTIVALLAYLGLRFDPLPTK